MASETTALKNLLGGATAGKLAKHRDVHTVGDLLAFWPRRYKTHDTDLSRLHPGEYVVVVAEVKSATTRPMRQRRGRMLTVVITDGRHDVEVAFFDARGHEHKLLPGTKAIFAGEVTRYRSQYQLAHPGYTVLDATEASGGRNGRPEPGGRGLIPIYLQVPKLHNWTIAECVRLVLEHVDELEDVLPAEVRARRRLLGRLEAVRALHRPHDLAEVERGRRRQRYEEAFVLQCVLARRRLRQTSEEAVARASREGGLRAAFDARLPFELTTGQVTVGEVLAEEMSRETPMHRLLQGEVGSGKTLVALRAMLAAVDAGGQAALLAPTEVLAAQHHRSVTAMLGDLAEGGMLGGSEIGTRVALLTGSMSTAARRQALLDVASGEAGIVVGTHALIQDAVDFFDLALVVVDEQHRFGVEQRDALRSKGRQPPHVLVMTATPIPRTVAMTVFGDMEISTLRELPRGRQPITTHVVPEERPEWVERTWRRVAEEVRAGRQVYVVCPRIGGDAGPSDGEDLPDAPRMTRMTRMTRTTRTTRTARTDPTAPRATAPRHRGGRWRASSTSTPSCSRPRRSRVCGSRCSTGGSTRRRRTRRCPGSPPGRSTSSSRRPSSRSGSTSPTPASWSSGTPSASASPSSTSSGAGSVAVAIRASASSCRGPARRPPAAASRPSPRRPTASSSPGSTSPSVARATFSGPGRAAVGPSWSSSRSCATRTSSPTRARTRPRSSPPTPTSRTDPPSPGQSGRGPRPSRPPTSRRADRAMTRIISGAAGGRRLHTPSGHRTRPTSDRVREALFSALESRGGLRGAHVMDLYSGSGALGLEAASRGAGSVLLVESHRQAAGVIRRNIADLGLRGAEVRAATVEAALDRPATLRYDLVLADPPYDVGEAALGRVLDLLIAREWLADDAAVVVERSTRSPEPTWPPGLVGEGRRRYGETTLWYAGTALAPAGPPAVPRGSGG